MQMKSDTMPYITSQTRYICDTYKNRSGGSKSERQCQKYFKTQLLQWSDSVVEEEFTLNSGAFMGWIIPASIIGILSVTFYWMGLDRGVIFHALGFGLMSLALLTFLFEYGLYFRFIDFLYPKRTSSNIFARRAPSGEVKQRIIFGGHADAAFEMKYVLGPHRKSSFYVVIGALAGMLYVWALSLAALIGGPRIDEGIIWPILGTIANIFIPVFAASMFFINWKRVVDGANDNLSACLVSMSVIREMDKAGSRLQNTEVCCLITGAEEEGLRGSMAFAKKHKEEFSDVETIFIALETLREVEQLQIYPRGINGTQKNSLYVADLIREAGRNCGLELSDADIYPGATDAEAFSRNGLLACGLGGVDHLPQTYYHTRYDNPDNINEDCMQISLDICLEAARIYDERIRKETASTD